MRKIHDAYFKQAKREGYFARSIYKLKEIDKKFKLFKPGDAVLDLGSAPGSWLQYLREKTGSEGKLAGIDIQPVKPSIKKIALILRKDITLCQADDFSQLCQRFKSVVSDMAPKTSGIKFTDQAGSLELCKQGFSLAEKVLSKGGNFVAKVFASPALKEFTKELQMHFREVQMFKPQSSRNESFETFIIARGFALPPKPKKNLEPKPKVVNPKKGRKGGQY